MRITENKKVSEIKTITKDILCNKCGESCTPKFSKAFCGLIEVEVYGNYHSEVLEDLKKYTFSICEKCLDIMFAEFIIHPKTDIYNPWV